MPDIGVPELLVILVIIIVLFGPSRLTDIMGALGKGLSEFRKATTNAPSPTKPAEIQASSSAQDTTQQVEPPKNS